MMSRLFILFATLVVSAFSAPAKDRTTWITSNFVTLQAQSSTVFDYGPTSIKSINWTTSFSSTTIWRNKTTSSDSSVTTWIGVTVTLPSTTSTWLSTTTLSHPLVVTSSLATSTAWTSPTIATVTLPPTATASGDAQGTTVTKYTGTYVPFPGQNTTWPTAWVTGGTVHFTYTETYNVTTQIGKLVTTTTAFTDSTYLTTKTTSGTSIVTYAPFPYKETTYLSTLTVTSTDYQLAYTTKPTPTSRPKTTTVTHAARCAPSNLISGRDGHGVTISLGVNFTFPLGFRNTLIGVPGFDRGACCQLCVDNPGCAASEWAADWDGACRLFYHNHPGNDTCGGGEPVQYYAQPDYYIPWHEGFIQAGCGELQYLGVNSF